MSKEVVNFYEQIAQANKEFIDEKVAALIKQNLDEDEINHILHTDDEFVEGHEIITILLPIRKLIDTLLQNKKHKSS
jgi:hypothetical protein